MTVFLRCPLNFLQLIGLCPFIECHVKGFRLINAFFLLDYKGYCFFFLLCCFIYLSTHLKFLK